MDHKVTIKTIFIVIIYRTKLYTMIESHFKHVYITHGHAHTNIYIYILSF